jgi:hypothetical protein
MRDLFWNMVDTRESHLDQFESLRVYINEQYQILKRRFNCKTHVVHDTWSTMRFDSKEE